MSDQTSKATPDLVKIKLFGLWEIDLAKIPRPERSGLISIATMFLLLGSVGVSGGDLDLRFWERERQVTAAEIRRDYHVTLLYPGRHGSKVKDCACRWEWRSNDGKTSGLFFIPPEIPCGMPINGDTPPPGVWEFYDDGAEMARWLCEGEEGKENESHHGDNSRAIPVSSMRPGRS